MHAVYVPVLRREVSSACLGTIDAWHNSIFRNQWSVGGFLSSISTTLASSASASSFAWFLICCISSYSWPICWSKIQLGEPHAESASTCRSFYQSSLCPSLRLSMNLLQASDNMFATPTKSRSVNVSLLALWCAFCEDGLTHNLYGVLNVPVSSELGLHIHVTQQAFLWA